MFAPSRSKASCPSTRSAIVSPGAAYAIEDNALSVTARAPHTTTHHARALDVNIVPRTTPQHQLRDIELEHTVVAGIRNIHIARAIHDDPDRRVQTAGGRYFQYTVGTERTRLAKDPVRDLIGQRRGEFEHSIVLVSEAVPGVGHVKIGRIVD